MFNNFEKHHFPKDLCTDPNEREPKVRDSSTRFLCILVDSKFPQECRLKILNPYTCPDSDDPELLLYGWTDGSNVFDHKDQSIHDDDERVVAWKRLEGTPPDFQRMLGNGPGQNTCCDCGKDISTGVSYGVGGSRTGRDGFFRCPPCHFKG